MFFSPDFQLLQVGLAAFFTPVETPTTRICFLSVSALALKTDILEVLFASARLGTPFRRAWFRRAWFRRLATMASTTTTTSTTETAQPVLPSLDTVPVVQPAPKTKLHGRAFYESIGSPKRIIAPMVDQSEFVSPLLFLRRHPPSR